MGAGGEGKAKAVFLDRDDTINQDVPYCSRPEDFQLLPTVGSGIKRLNREGFKVVVITNQAGIGRGYFTEAALGEIHKKMAADLAEYGAHVDAIYYCPHHPDANCECRKPKPRLAHQAMEDLKLDPKRCYVIGDRLLDVELARAIGGKVAMVPQAPGREELKNARAAPDCVCADFESAVRWIIETEAAR